MAEAEVVHHGLENIIADESAISWLDGQRGVLVYRGIDIRALAEHSTFEETAYLLWFGRLPTQAELDQVSRQMAQERGVDPQVFTALKTAPKNAVPMHVLMAALGLLATYDPEASDNSPEAEVRKALRVTAQMATIVAAYQRIRQGLEPVAPDPSLSHAANFLYMLRGQKPSATEARVMDIALILHADHEFNASTFAARVVASTLADLHSAVIGALGALKGPLHGGANEQVMGMLLKIQDPARAADWVRDALANKQRIMGFGHRVYKTWDPRALWLKNIAQELAEDTGNRQWYAISQNIEDTVMAEKKLYPNVDFYSASVYYTLGIPTDLFTPVFAVSRVAGWTAHILEQHAHNRLIRPRALYTGPRDAEYIPLAERQPQPA